MADPEARRLLAERAAEIFNAGGVTYQEAIGQAMQEFNPDGDPELAEQLMKSLLNVPEEKPVLKRHQFPPEEFDPSL